MSLDRAHTTSLRPYEGPYRAERPAFWWLLEREVVRYLKIWHFTIAGQVLSALLFVLVFGLALGRQVNAVDQIPYQQFILPGLIAQAVVTVGYINGTASLFEARKDRYIHDILASPLRWWEINLALILGAILRAVLVAAAILVVAVPLTGAHIEYPTYFAIAAAAILVVAAQVGVLAATYAQRVDHVYSTQVLIVQPLCFLAGVFYSVNDLSTPWRMLTYANPVFYVVQALQYGMLGRSDIPSGLALLAVTVTAVVLSLWSAWQFRSGVRLKP